MRVCCVRGGERWPKIELCVEFNCVCVCIWLGAAEARPRYLVDNPVNCVAAAPQGSPKLAARAGPGGARARAGGPAGGAPGVPGDKLCVPFSTEEKPQRFCTQNLTVISRGMLWCRCLCMS